MDHIIDDLIALVVLYYSIGDYKQADELMQKVKEIINGESERVFKRESR